jgi:myo-inositol-1(or 4)-monophosphatase
MHLTQSNDGVTMVPVRSPDTSDEEMTVVNASPASALDTQADRHEEASLLATVVEAVQAAGKVLLDRYASDTRPVGREDIFAAGRRNEQASLAVLRPALAVARPKARWVDDDQEARQLPDGEWWTVDAVEGNVNHVHGLAEWCVSVTLIRDNTPVLAAVYQPVGDLTYTAAVGNGAHLNGQPLHTSRKTELAWAIATTSQAESGQKETYRLIGDSIAAMLYRVMLVRATVPSTFPLLMVAAGHADLFWEYAPVLPGVAAGALMIREAGGLVSDVEGRPWAPGSPSILAAAPGVHAAAIETLISMETS